MHICYLIGGSGLCGGMENHVIDLSGELLRLGCSVTVITSKQLAHRFDEKIEVYTVPFNTWRHNPILRRKILKIIKNSTFDVIHSHGNKATDLVRSIPSHYVKVVTAHNHKSRLERYKKFDGIIGVCSELIADLNQRKKIRTIYNGVDIGSASSEVVQDIQIPVGSSATVMAAGRFVDAKGFDLLIEALVEIPKVMLWLIGDGPNKDQLMNQIDRLGLKDRIWMPGFMPRNTIVNLMSRCDLFVISSRYEGGPITLAEALLMKCPVVSTRVGFVPEILLERHLIEDVSSSSIRVKIEEFFKEESMRLSYEPIFRSAENKLTLSSMAAKTLQFYEELLVGEKSS